MDNSQSQRVGGEKPGSETERQAANSVLTGRTRFQRASRCQPVDRPPVWLMRQAGRALPEYRALKETYSFVDMVRTPDLAVEVTLQPIKRFGFDAAVFFSDILVIPEALGQSYHFREQGGVEMEFPIRSRGDLARLRGEGLLARLDYVRQAMTTLRHELGDQTALLGFAGSPWTLANFMMEGGSSRDFQQAKALFYADRAMFNELMELLTEAVAEHVQMQIDAGADAIQLFDSTAGVLAGDVYEEASARWLAEVIHRLKRPAPVIIFARGLPLPWEALARTGTSALSIDWRIPMSVARRECPDDWAIQGNLDPALMATEPGIVREACGKILEAMRGRPGHIFNLGHGLPQTAKLDNISALVESVQNFS